MQLSIYTSFLICMMTLFDFKKFEIYFVISMYSETRENRRFSVHQKSMIFDSRQKLILKT